MKKSFILHIDSLAILNEMTIEQKGILFDAIYKYNIGQDVELDFGMKMAFAPFKNQFIRDANKYSGFIDKQKENGSKGGRPKKDVDSQIVNNKPTEPNESQKTQPFLLKPKKAYNDSVSDSDSDNKNDNKNNIPPKVGRSIVLEEINLNKSRLMNGFDTSEFSEEFKKYYSVAELFRKMIKKNIEASQGVVTNIDKETIGNWVKPIRDLYEIDKASPESVEKVYKFIIVDTFWKANILSTKKLREKFNTLLVKINSNNPQPQTMVAPVRARTAEQLEYDRARAENGN